MLILTRRVGETLMIGDQVSVTVLGVKGRAMHEHLQHLDQDYQLSYEEDNSDFPRHNNFNR